MNHRADAVEFSGMGERCTPPAAQAFLWRTAMGKEGTAKAAFKFGRARAGAVDVLSADLGVEQPLLAAQRPYQKAEQSSFTLNAAASASVPAYSGLQSTR